MNNFSLFTDASLNPGFKVGVGGYLLVPDSLLTTPATLIKRHELDEMLVLKRFENTSSTKLEIQTVLWALEEYCSESMDSEVGHLHIYSDSQGVEKLLSRRERLENNGFQSRGGSRLLRNASLYANYYALYDRLQFEVTKVPGHTRARSRNTVQQIFSLIDQKVRKILKQWVSQLEATQAEWYVYLIRCGDDTLYTGISNDVGRRFESHQGIGKQGAKYLRGRGPLELVFQKKIGSKSAASKMEQQIKKLSKLQKERIIHQGKLEL